MKKELTRIRYRFTKQRLNIICFTLPVLIYSYNTNEDRKRKRLVASTPCISQSDDLSGWSGVSSIHRYVYLIFLARYVLQLND